MRRAADGGAPLDRFYRGFEHVVRSFYVYRYCTVDLDGPTLTLRAVAPEEHVIDEMVARKRPWPR